MTRGRPTRSLPQRGRPHHSRLMDSHATVFAHRPARAVQQLRGLHSHRRLDVQPARQMAEGTSGTSLAAEGLIAELAARLSRLAAGSQWVHAPGSWAPRPRYQQEGRYCARVPAARYAFDLGFMPGRPEKTSPSLKSTLGTNHRHTLNRCRASAPIIAPKRIGRWTSLSTCGPRCRDRRNFLFGSPNSETES